MPALQAQMGSLALGGVGEGWKKTITGEKEEVSEN